MWIEKKISKDQSEELNIEKQSESCSIKQYFNEAIQLIVIKLVYIAKIFEHSSTQLHIYKIMPNNFLSDLPYYMFNFIMTKVNCLSVVLVSNQSKKKSNCLFQQKLLDQDQHSYYFHEILGITDKRSIVLKYNVLLYDKQINCQIIVKMMNEIYGLIIESHARLLTIDQSKDMFEIDNELNNLVGKLNNECTFLNKVI